MTEITIPPFGSVDVKVRFNPIATGVRTGSLSFTSNTPSSPHTLSLRGESFENVPAPEFGITPTNIIFPSTVVGNISPNLTVTLRNPGELPLLISSVAVPIGFSIVGAYPTEIAAGGNAPLVLRFSPTSVGTKTGSLLVYSNAKNTAHEIPMSGVATAASLSALTYLSADGSKLKDNKGAGSVVQLRSVNWYGFEQIGVPSGAWTRPFRTKSINGVLKEGMLEEIKRLGFDSIRLLFSQDVTWAGTKPNTIGGDWNSTYINVDANPEFLVSTVGENPQNVKTTIQILDLFVDWCEALKLRIVFDMHTLAPDNDNVLATHGKWYTTTNPNDPGQTGGIRREARNEAQAIAAHVFLANRYKNRPVVCGFDIINEPHNCVWDRNPVDGILGFYERAGNAIHAVNPDVLVICEGNTGNIDHTPVGHETDAASLEGKYTWSTWWSGKLDEARMEPVVLNVPNKVVYSPHEYGAYLQGVALQPWFTPATRVGNTYAGLAFPANMPDVWSRQWGYLVEENIAPVWIGEFGSYLRIGGDPITGGGSAYSAQDLALDEQWLDTLGAYCEQHAVGFAYWAWPPGGDPDGLVGQQPAGTWGAAQQFKLPYLDTFITPVVVAPLTLSGTQLSFAETSAGTVSQKTLTVYNNSAFAISVLNTVSGAGYTVSPQNVTVLPGSSSTITVTFTPSTEGSFTGTLSITPSTGSILTVLVSGFASNIGTPVDPDPTGPLVSITLPSNAYGITAVGDSLTEGGLYLSNGWMQKACFYGNQVFRHRGNVAVSGSTPQQSLELQLSKVMDMVPPPKVCVVASGTNSIYGGISAFTYIQQICTALVARNIYPVLWTIPPRNDTTGQDANMAVWNQAVKDYHLETGIPLFDAFEALRVPGSYRGKAGVMNADGLHFSNYGYTVLGKYLIDSKCLAGIPIDGKLGLATTVGGSNLCPNPLFTGGSNGVSTNLTLPAGYTGEQIPSEVAGNWQRITREANQTVVGANVTKTATLAVIPIVAGQKHTLAVKIRWDAKVKGGTNMEFAAWHVGLLLMVTDQSWSSYPNNLYVAFGPQGAEIEEGTIFVEFTAPAGANRLALNLMSINPDVPDNALPVSIDYSQLTVITGSFPYNNIDPSPGVTTGPVVTPAMLTDTAGSVMTDSLNSPIEASA
jgi:aryl-phospho-beta-D-glucosidase BglC (GH1 family)/lysophospholipase L1-like esterase